MSACPRAAVLLAVITAAAVAASAPASANERGPLAPIVRASMHTVSNPASPPPRETLGDALGRFGEAANHAMYGFNAWLYSGWNALTAASSSSPTGAAVASAASNLFLNWINEPITMASYTLVGRFDEAGISGRRFLVNTFRGWGGVLDPATANGLVVPRIDLGLALCALGTPGGPYTVLPVVGPRTVRDGVADLVAVNGLFLLVLAPLGLPTGTIVLILVLDEVVHLALMRQIDAVATEDAAARSFDEVRTAYLAEREERCGQLREGRNILS